MRVQLLYLTLSYLKEGRNIKLMIVFSILISYNKNCAKK